MMSGRIPRHRSITTNESLGSITVRLRCRVDSVCVVKVGGVGVVRNDTTASSDGLVDQMSVQPTLLQQSR